MALLVQKFGGTSVADPDRIRAVADHVARTHRQGDDVVVVVSAMGKTTDDLMRLANDGLDAPSPAARWTCCSPRASASRMALLCMALAELGVEASSFTGTQAGIVTDTAHGKAKILEVKGDRLRDALAAGQVAVVAGFQGVSTANDITTLGRGGSDTTAVALAAAFGADACEIYTDVAGVFTADPRIVPNARRLSRVSFDEMLEMAATGGRVLALRSVEFARNHHVPLHVRSSFTWEPGTWVTEEDATMEAGDHLRRHPRHLGGEGHDRAGARPARRRGRAVPRARRRVGERRHDRAERLDRRRHRHLVHGAQGGPDVASER